MQLLFFFSFFHQHLVDRVRRPVTSTQFVFPDESNFAKLQSRQEISHRTRTCTIAMKVRYANEVLNVNGEFFLINGSRKVNVERDLWKRESFIINTHFLIQLK